MRTVQTAQGKLIPAMGRAKAPVPVPAQQAKAVIAKAFVPKETMKAVVSPVIIAAKAGSPVAKQEMKAVDPKTAIKLDAMMTPLQKQYSQNQGGGGAPTPQGSAPPQEATSEETYQDPGVAQEQPQAQPSQEQAQEQAQEQPQEGIHDEYPKEPAPHDAAEMAVAQITPLLPSKPEERKTFWKRLYDLIFGAEDESMGDGFGAEDSPISCYVQNGRLCCTAIQPTAWGVVPLMASVRVSGYPDGPVTLGANPSLDAAIGESTKRLMASSVKESQKLAAESLVNRARCGDQNAMAIIALVRQHAPSSERARTAQHFIAEYIKAHPVTDSMMAGEEAAVVTPDVSVGRAAVRLANGPALTHGRVGSMISIFGGRRTRKQKILKHAIARFGSERSHADEHRRIRARLDAIEQTLFDFGRALGLARAIQTVRNDGPVKALSSSAGWELGE
jgi:hypothetical protein